MTSRHRLRGRRRFAAVREAGLRASAAGVRAQLADNDVAVARVGYAIVGIRSAVQRNLLRRRLREAMRPQLAGLAGHDVVIIAGAQAAALPFAALRDAVVAATARVLDRSRRASAVSSADNGVMTSTEEGAG